MFYCFDPTAAAVASRTAALNLAFHGHGGTGAPPSSGPNRSFSPSSAPTGRPASNSGPLTISPPAIIPPVLPATKLNSDLLVPTDVQPGILEMIREEQRVRQKYITKKVYALEGAIDILKKILNFFWHKSEGS